MLKIRTLAVRILLATAIAAILIGAPSTPAAYAGDCATSGSHNCGG